ncbi:MAG: DUF169 domain-containing protein [Candidatus Bathyarchaeota archaeon]|nr:DUF169 domain-containing protein [Candidatus Bathyarchaeota archaeon]
MDNCSIKTIGEKIQAAGKLKLRPLCVSGSETVPQEAIKVATVNSCLAKAIFTVANKEKPPTLYFGKEVTGGCCPGGTGWTGYAKMAPMMDYFISTGYKQFRNGEAEYLKASPEVVAESKKAVGNITPLATYTVISAFDTIEKNVEVHSFICFGNAEQIRNLCSLIHFRSTDPFNSVSAAFGPSCATIITYPAGLAEKAPKDTAFLGPVDPTGNCWFPQDYMSLGIPLKLAIAMCEDLEQSFITKRPQVAYPSVHETMK